MEKELEQIKEGSGNEVALKEEDNIGVVRIADDVVAMIASIAATEVEGVSALAGNITNELMSRVGMKKLSRGVKVEIHDGVVKVDLAGARERIGELEHTLKVLLLPKDPNDDKNVIVEIRGGVVKVDLAVCIQFGYNIPEVSQKLQNKVKSAIENMTGLTCGNVDVRFTNVTMK